jgi:hypothetical protein
VIFALVFARKNRLPFFISFVLFLACSFSPIAGLSQTPPPQTPTPQTRPSEEFCRQEQTRVQQKITEAGACTQDSECIRHYDGCGFACESYINASKQQEIQNEVSAFKKLGCSVACKDCYVPPGPLACIAKRCERISASEIEATLGPLNPADCKSEQRRIEKESRKARACKTSEDCTVSPLGCPFSCHGLVNKLQHPRMLALYTRLRKACSVCEYKCAAPSGTPYCLKDHCVWKE